MRGYFQGRFRDRQFLSFQAEYRSPLLFWRISTAAFAGAGRVADKVSKLDFGGLKPSFGGGFRIMLDKVDRFDLGFGEDGNTGFYVGFSEAF